MYLSIIPSSGLSMSKYMLLSCSNYYTEFSIICSGCNADVTEVSSSLMHYSSGRLQQDAPGTKEHQGDHSRSLSAPRNGVSNTSKLGVEATLASTQSPTQGGAGKDDMSPFSGEFVIC